MSSLVEDLHPVLSTLPLLPREEVLTRVLKGSMEHSLVLTVRVTLSVAQLLEY